MLAVVSDSSPLIYLTRLELLPLLGRLHDKVIIPQAVWQEVVVGGQGLPESANLRRAVSDGWIEVQAPQASASSLGADSIKLGRGEVEAILLAKELDRLRTQTNFRISEKLYREALREGGELQDSQEDSAPK